MKPTHRTPLAILLAVLFLVPPTPALPAAPSAGQPDATATVPVSDTDLEIAVEARLLADPAVSSHGIDVTVKDGIVTLAGIVDNLLSKDRAVTVCESIKGVASVIDRVQVVTQKVSDQELEQMVAFALSAAPVSSKKEPTVTARNGLVTLEGRTDSWQKSFIYERIARGVRGVTGVVNQIDVVFDMTRTATEIAREIRQRLAWDAYIDDRQIEVEVNRGKATLSGVVASALEKRRTARSAWIIGVTAVDTGDLAVDWSRYQGNLRRSRKTAVTGDEALKRAIAETLRQDPRVPEATVEIHVDSGVVALTGRVDTLAAKRAATEDVRNTRGVWLVRDYLKVRPGSGVLPTSPMIDQDARTTRDIRKLLEMDPLIPQDHISVTVSNSLVRLGGIVTDAFLKTRAEAIAAQLRSAVHIINDIQVNHRWQPLEDRVIRRNVLDELFWSPYVDADRIHVEVADGIVTLMGAVDTLAGRRIATENAFEGGAREVRSRLHVTGESSP